MSRPPLLARLARSVPGQRTENAHTHAHPTMSAHTPSFTEWSRRFLLRCAVKGKVSQSMTYREIGRRGPDAGSLGVEDGRLVDVARADEARDNQRLHT